MKPQYDELRKLITQYGLRPIHKVQKGGGIWFKGDGDDEIMKSFAADCEKIGCILRFKEDSKTLGHISGWYIDVPTEYLSDYKRGFNRYFKVKKNEKETTISDAAFELIKESGFEYVDKRDKPDGSLWIVAGEDEAEELIDKCKNLGALFKFSKKGSKSTGNKPGWYAK